MTKIQRADRTAAMAEMRDAGRTLQEIGDSYDLTRERVRQIIGNTGHILNTVYAKDERRCYRCKQTKKVDEFYTDKCHVCVACTKKRSLEVMKSQHAQDYQKGGKYYKAQLCRQNTNYMIKTGKLIKGDCLVGKDNGFVDCRGRIEAHHHKGYDHPEEVEFYCVKHHKEIDGSKWGKT